MDYASSSTLKTICFLVFILVGSTSAQQNTRCPFDLMYHFGDGVFDTGNAIASMPYGPKLPAARLPYGETYLNRPTGRWSDGLTDIDYGARGLGFPDVLSYLEGDAEKSNAVMFAVARSPVLDRAFFTARRLRIPPYAGSLNIQMSWFKKYLATVCFTPEDCADKLSNSIIIFGDVEANDITYALIQGKSFEEVHTYVKYVTEAQVNAARELIRLGATRIVVPGNAPIGCYPFILTELATNETNAYDEIGCLRSVNDLMIYKNNDLRVAIDDLAAENPDIFLYYADFYSTEYAMLRNQSINGPYSNVTLQACCGEGGKYNYNSRRFCGAPGVESCADPTQYFFWDGIHLTQEANRRLSIVLQRGALGLFNCTVPPLSQTWSYM